MPLTRREFVSRGAFAAAGAAAGSSVLAQDAPKFIPPKAGAVARHIIHMVSDGMSAGTLTCADHLSHLTRKRGSTWMRLYQEPGARHGYMDMRSLDSWVTDSSAASSSWGCGSRIRNGGVNVLPDGRHLKHLYELFGAEGWARGLVTTTEITHATPAGFAASVRSRSMSPEIASQYLNGKVEVLLGGGAKYFEPGRGPDKRDLGSEFQKSGYTIVRDRDALQKVGPGGRLLGLFADGHVPYTVDRNHSEALRKSVPTLAEMTSAALRRLGRQERFILQVEGGRVDHGCHTCDAAAAFYDQVAFDEAIDVVLDFQKANPDTLIVMTTDHGNGNPGLNGTGGNYVASNALFANLREVRASFGEILSTLGKGPTVDHIRTTIQELTGYSMPAGKAEMLAPFLEPTRKGQPKPGQAMYNLLATPHGQLGQLMANHVAVGWSGSAHTSDFVPILALGPGADAFGGFIQNTDVFRHYCRHAGIDFENPKLPLTAGLGSLPGETEAIQEYWHA